MPPRTPSPYLRVVLGVEFLPGTLEGPAASIRACNSFLPSRLAAASHLLPCLGVVEVGRQTPVSAQTEGGGRCLCRAGLGGSAWPSHSACAWEGQPVVLQSLRVLCLPPGGRCLPERILARFWVLPLLPAGTSRYCGTFLLLTHCRIWVLVRSAELPVVFVASGVDFYARFPGPYRAPSLFPFALDHTPQVGGRVGGLLPVVLRRCHDAALFKVPFWVSATPLHLLGDSRLGGT